MKKMSKRMTRIARMMMADYKLSGKPRGCIVFDGNMNRAAWLDEASEQGYVVGDTRGNVVHLY